MEARTKLNSATPTPIRSTKPHQTDPKKLVQQPNTHKGEQLASALGHKDWPSSEVLKICQNFADNYLYPEAQNEVGLINLRTLHNDGEALKYFRLAAENDNKEGQNNLGFMYENGRGVKQSNLEALEYYKKAAGQGLDIAKSNVDRLEGMLQDNSKENIAVKNSLEMYNNARRVFNGNGLNKPGPGATTNSPKPSESSQIDSKKVSINNGTRKNNML